MLFTVIFRVRNFVGLGVDVSDFLLIISGHADDLRGGFTLLAEAI